MKVNKGHIIPPARCNQFGSTNRVHGFLAHDFAWLPSEGRGAYVRKQCVTGMPPMRSRNWGLQPKPAALFAGEERPGFHPNYRFYETIIHRNIKKNWRWSTGWRFQVNKPNKFNPMFKTNNDPRMRRENNNLKANPLKLQPPTSAGFKHFAE